MYSAANCLKASSSAFTNPWLTQTVAVVAAALAMYGLPSVAAAASPREPRSTDLRLYLSIVHHPPGRKGRLFEGAPSLVGMMQENSLRRCSQRAYVKSMTGVWVST